MARDFECEDGWFCLVWQLSVLIEAEARRTGIDIHSETWPEVAQVKEKFGRLRFRLCNSTPRMLSLVDAAEEQSERLCEVCGAPAKVGEGYRVRCVEHSTGTLGSRLK